MTLPSDLNPDAFVPNSLKAELDFQDNVGPGGNKKQAKFIQERLCLAGYKVVIDGDFGSATKEALQKLQGDKQLPANGVYGRQEHDLLTKPFVNAVNPTPVGNRALGDMIVRVGRQHLKQRPIELGGDNCGPWVRMYMDGNEGEEWRWCAGFSFFTIGQACFVSEQPMPMKKTYTVDTIVERAKAANQFLSERQAATPEGRARIVSGSLFVVRASSTHWSHTGIVSGVNRDSFGTLEGNTNDDGSANGYEAIERTRGFVGKDFIIW